MFKLLKIKVIVMLMVMFSSICLAGTSINTYFSTVDKCDKVVIEHINNAQKTLDIAIYSFTLQNIADAIIVAQKRGVKVRVLMDKQQAGSKYAMDEYLEENGVKVYRDCCSGYMHNKIIIIDNETVLTGSYNFSKNATTRNAENLIVLKNKSIAEEYAVEFEKIYRHWGTDCGN